jgi:hypothetical protein
MKQIEFFNNITFFDNDELNNFEKFLLSPYFNTLKSTIIVFRIIKNNYKLIEGRNYNGLKVKILKESKYKEIHLRKILSKLNELYIEYIKIKAYGSEQYLKEFMCSNYLLSIGNFNLLSKRVKILDNILSSPDSTDHDLFLRLSEREILGYEIICSEENNSNPLTKISKQKEYTLDASRNMFVYIIIKETANFLNYKLQCNGIEDKAFSVDLEILYKAMKTPEFKSYNKLQITTINLFYKIYKLFENPLNDKYYKNYKTYFNEVKHMYNFEFCKTQVSILLNFCNFRQRLKDHDRYYFIEGLNWQYTFFDNNYYLEKNTKYLNSVIYRNFVISCFNSGEKALLKSFMDNKKIILNPEDESMMERFSIAHYSNLDGQFTLSIAVAKSLVNLKVYLKFDLLLLLIKSYYELNNLEGIEDTLHNYLHYIKEGDYFTKFERDRYLFFHKCMKRFVTLSYNYDKDKNIIEFELLMNEIKSKETFVMKNWLTDKVSMKIYEHNSKHKKKLNS